MNHIELEAELASALRLADRWVAVLRRTVAELDPGRYAQTGSIRWLVGASDGVRVSVGHWACDLPPATWKFIGEVRHTEIMRYGTVHGYVIQGSEDLTEYKINKAPCMRRFLRSQLAILPGLGFTLDYKQAWSLFQLNLLADV